MKLLNSFGPNPRMVRMFMAERGIELATEELDLLAAENRQAAYTARNPGGQMPALELDDGSVLAETTCICEYLDEKYPGQSMLGEGLEERANNRMWTRRVELNITEHIYNAFRYSEGLELFKDRMYCIPEAADGLKAKSRGQLEWLDGLMVDRDYVAGDSLRLADLVLYCCLDFAAGIGQPLDPQLKNLAAWFQRIAQRPSAEASLHPSSAAVGMKG
ncbi:glutathione S-transferase [Gammaproteobacteria bacterium 53_120_T64]|nr:glutathione S-transferase [Gammaproteobacteria bacterium 53_120_T64]